MIIYLVAVFKQKQANNDLIISRKVNENLTVEIENLDDL
jgi:hypothetical protein